MRGKRKTARVHIVLAPSDKELILRAANVAFSPESATVGTSSDILRDGAIRLSQDILDVSAGVLTEEEAMTKYVKLLREYVVPVAGEDKKSL